MTTGSRFPDPGYKITNRSRIDLTRYARPGDRSRSPGKHARRTPATPIRPQDLIWQIDARQNFYYMGPIPAFYWPHVVADLDDQQPPLRQFFFRTNNYFGQQLLTDWNGFRFINVKKPDWIDLWNIDIDYLSAPDQGVPGARQRDRLVRHATSSRDLSDPYHRDPATPPETFTKDYSATSTSGA